MPSMFDPEFHAKKKGISVEQAREIIGSWRPSNLQFWIKKTNGDIQLAETLWKDHQNKGMKTRLKDKAKMKSENPRTKEYWITRHRLSEAQAASEVSKFQSHNSLESYIERYGEVEGPAKFEQRQRDWQNTIQSKPAEELNRINKSKACDFNSKLEEMGVDGYLQFVNRSKMPVYELEAVDESVRCQIIKKFSPEFRTAAISGRIDTNLLDRLITEISQHGIISKFEKYVPYYPVFKLKKIDVVSHIKSTIYPDSFVKKSSRGHKVFYKGMIFDSKLEFGIYQYLCNKNIEIVQTKGRLKYPEGRLYFDLYLPQHDLYIECTGMMKYKWYRDKMDLKKSIVKKHNLNCLFISSVEELMQHI